MEKYALISVAEKRGIVPFARLLNKHGFRIIATDGTANVLQKGRISVTCVEEITGFPACLGGRVKTLHPKILGGILFDRRSQKHRCEAKKFGFPPIAVVVVNPYSFQGTEETIDIGGVSLLRAAAKNFQSVTVVCDPADYHRITKELKKNGEVPLTLRKELALKAFLRTASYDASIAAAHSEQKLRYGENPHQWGMFYERSSASPKPSWTLHQGKSLSYCNILDADAAWNLVQEFSQPTAALIKHTNPCGVASYRDLSEAFRRAYACDRTSAFGVIIGLNRECTASVVQEILERHVFTEVIVAPGFERGALKLLKQKPNLRAMEIPYKLPSFAQRASEDRQATPAHRSLLSAIALPAGRSSSEGWATADGEGESYKLRYRSALGGILLQNADHALPTRSTIQYITRKKPTARELEDLLFAWKVVKHAKSNAIVLARNNATVGIGCGQTSRIDALWLAARHAGDRAQGSVMASDAFFPFSDSVEEAATLGITAIIQPGGSIRDAEVIEAANRRGLAIVTTGKRAFSH